MNFKRDAVWCYNGPIAEELDAAAKTGAEVKLHAMWMSRWQDGNTLQDVLVKCVDMHVQILSMRWLVSGKPEAYLTAVVTKDTPHGTIKRECTAINSPGLLEFTKGTNVVLHYYGEDRTLQLTSIANQADLATSDAATEQDASADEDAAGSGQMVAADNDAITGQPAVGINVD